KFIGGPGTPGVLVARSDLLANRVPDSPGGGTVAYVNAREHRYLADPVHREEGGTPAIIEAIRAGLVFQLKEAVGARAIRDREHALIRRAIDRWRSTESLRILGNPDAWRLSIVSLLVRYEAGYLHHGFVVALLNDLFGIQARGGCSCAGPYGHRLLGIDLVQSHAFEREILRGCEGVKPGWVRVGFNYFISDATFEYVLEAVELVARDGWRLLPDYTFCPDSGLWRHRAGRSFKPSSLLNISYTTGRLSFRSRHATEPESALADYLEEARRVLAAGAELAPAEDPCITPDFQSLRWFPLPGEAAARLAAERG
ncbi:MAG: aminotransferase class V-fold PLP-dependent enzyme, partial [Myxococcales bacterium]|nr:aminotransferase class V-fold PLP-dependent enzyme [Myxococcales bacterium]